MKSGATRPVDDALLEASSKLREAASAKKCWPCGCLHSTLEAIGPAFPDGQAPGDLFEVVSEVEERLSAVRYDCLGCGVCRPALAINALAGEFPGKAQMLVSCPTEKPAKRQGWPPLAGAYNVLRYQAPVAVCSLTDKTIAQAISEKAPAEVSIVGTMFTENLGVERLLIHA